ncbi:hypothetical protein QJS10_CPA05g01539 [Acorus calamus]|uniref:Uncharacterized protein n=1 Tax=Acorus calamus TaxID=4465 RepID=A0AAV9EXS3_ACOCL|nr:hypothetical protein QJS10_CPA05g01539 [Acorus calamus]
MRAMETLRDLLEEAKVRTLYWALCIFGIAYFLSHTSNSMWANIPISILVLVALRFLSYEVELRWRVRPVYKPTYLSHLMKKQLSLNDPRLSTTPPVTRWKRKIGSPQVEAAMEDFINKLLQDFMVDLWYSSITPDKEAPEQIRALILDVLGEISGRVKEINLLDLLTSDMVELVGSHLDLFRRNQSSIGVDVMGILSSEERDERLKHHLIASKELHPALLSSDCEYKVLQRLVGGVIAVVLRPREAQCPLVRCFCRELLTCLVVQPLLNLASPMYINELIEYLFLTATDEQGRPTNANNTFHDQPVSVGNNQNSEPESKRVDASTNQSKNLPLVKIDTSEHGQQHIPEADSLLRAQPKPADWARALEATQQRRTQVLAPENLENLWTKGRNYKKKNARILKAGISSRSANAASGAINQLAHVGVVDKKLPTNAEGTRTEDSLASEMHGVNLKSEVGELVVQTNLSEELIREPSLQGRQYADEWEEGSNIVVKSSNSHIKRSSSTSALTILPDIGKNLVDKSSDAKSSNMLHNPNYYIKYKEEQTVRSGSEFIFHSEGSLHIPKLKCRVVGAYFEKIGSRSFAVYSIAVSDAENKTWFVKRRYRNFERLHRHLKGIPNYTLHLPPKRFLSSSIDDYFVHQRCILLDKYLQDLLSIANVAEQHEVWDFFSISSKNYSFGKSTSVMKTLAVNVDDAMDDIVRQFKGVSDGLLRKVSGSPSTYAASSITERRMALSWNEEDTNKHSQSNSSIGTSHSLSDEEEDDKDETHNGVDAEKLVNGWHSDNELNSRGFPPRVVIRHEEFESPSAKPNKQAEVKFGEPHPEWHLPANSKVTSDILEDPVGVPPEWIPPNVSVPLLNLVDNIFQLKQRGWLRQVFWISKQILQLVMEDAIDDWLLRQIHRLRREDIIAHAIRWIQDVLWPNGTFFIDLESRKGKVDDYEFGQRRTKSSVGDKVSKSGSFELHLEAARRASEVKKMIIGGAPSTLVSLIGNKQYQRCANDIYYFLQSTVCIKQLTYGMLELLLVSIFPELHDLVLDIHNNPPPTSAQ